MKSFFSLFLSWGLLFTLSACTTMAPVNPFNAAVNDAAVVTPQDVCTQLIPVRPENPALTWSPDKSKVLVVMWKSRDSYEKFYKDRTRTDTSPAYVTWVTTAHQVRDFGTQYLKAHPAADPAALELRLKQYLGLKPEWNYDVFVEMWVDPREMFRPCTDPEIDDTACDVDFASPPPRVAAIPDYPAFYKNLYFQDFRTRPGIPWTGMGYTYDWGASGRPVGASEYILIPGATYEISRVVDTLDYFKTP